MALFPTWHPHATTVSLLILDLGCPRAVLSETIARAGGGRLHFPTSTPGEPLASDLVSSAPG